MLIMRKYLHEKVFWDFEITGANFSDVTEIL